MKIKTFILILFVFTQSSYADCYPDKEISFVKTDDYGACTTWGICTMADNNPETGQYEVYYGWHNECPGRFSILVETYTCQDSYDRNYTNEYRYRNGNCNPL